MFFFFLFFSAQVELLFKVNTAIKKTQKMHSPKINHFFFFLNKSKSYFYKLQQIHYFAKKRNFKLYERVKKKKEKKSGSNFNEAFDKLYRFV